MDFSEQWKSLWPVSSVFSPPSLFSDAATATPLAGRNSGDNSPPKPREIGPLFFNPSPETLTQIIDSPSLYTRTPSPFPYLSLSRFLESTTKSILPSTSSSIASTYGPEISRTPLPYNSLQSLRCPGSGRVFIFFATGQNSDQMGFLLLSVEGGQVGVKVSGAGNSLNHRILKFSVQKVENSPMGSGDSCFRIVGFLMICTMYSVYWYAVKIKGLGSDSETPKLELLGSKLFKSCGVVHACWSPHLEEECVVLLESGDLFLFDLGSYYSGESSNMNFKGKNLRASWDDLNVLGKDSWLSCEFSWHPRILVVAHSSAVFLVDLRMERCKVDCLLRIDMSADDSFVENDRFVAFSRAGSDGFHFTVSSKCLLFLCDVRNPLMPMLQWVHGIDNPTYITVVKLLELRSNSKNDEYKWASENGYCILMGTFWNCEFSLFCYGPDTRTSVASEISKFCKSLYAWELPSELSLAARDCYCGSCLVREEFSKDVLPEWVDWQQKKEIVLGYCILDKDLCVQLFKPEDFGGFTVIRLMSSGKLELQRYFASKEAVNFSDKAHKKSSILFEESLLYRTGDEEYKFPKEFQYLKLDYLYGHLNDDLGKVLTSKKRKTSDSAPDVSSNSDFHQDICQKLEACGISKFKSSADISYAVRDIVSPMSISEIAVMSTWSSLPPVLLRMGFVTHVELFNSLVNQKKLSLEFLDVPLQPQLPPFVFRNPSHCSNKWSRKMQHDNALVGPTVPLPFLVTYNKLYIEGEEEEDGQSANHQLELQCSKVMQMVNSENLVDEGERVVSLANDKDDMSYGSQNRDTFSLYEPVAFSDKISNADPTSGSSTCENKNYSTFIGRNSPKEECVNVEPGFINPEAIDAICPTGFKFNRALGNLPAEFKYFIGQQKKFQDSFFAKRSRVQKQNP